MKSKKSNLQNKLLLFLVYMMIAFVCAYLYRQFKN